MSNDGVISSGIDGPFDKAAAEDQASAVADRADTPAADTGCPDVAVREEKQEPTAKLSLSELTAGWKDLEERKPCLVSTIRFGAKTNLGHVRENNEDKFDFYIPDQTHILAARGCLYAVADGMGGHAAGQIASEYALNVLIHEYFSDTTSSVEDGLRSAIEKANLRIFEAAAARPERNSMGTTLTSAVIWEDDLFLGHVGDSRAYLYREGELRQVTNDHSWVAEQVRLGAMTPEDAEISPFRNLITRSLGNLLEVEVDIYHEKILDGDLVLLCSDGLSGMLSDDEIAQTLACKAPSLATLMLVERANEAGGRDNITAVVLQIAGIEAFEKKRFRWPGSGKSPRR